MSQYRVARGVIRKPRDPLSARKVATAADYIGQGEAIPEGMLSEAEIANLLATGYIEPIGLIAPGVLEPTVKRGKWSVDPAALVAKSLEDMLVMVLEIDPDYDVAALETVTAAATQLTADWNPAFREAVALSNDRTRPAPLRSTAKVNRDGKVVEVRGARDVAEIPMSDSSKEILDRARAQAAQQAPGKGDQPQG